MTIFTRITRAISWLRGDHPLDNRYPTIEAMSTISDPHRLAD